MNRSQASLLVSVLILGAFLLPVAYLIYGAFFWGLSSYVVSPVSLLTSFGTWVTIGNTMELTLAHAVIVVGLAFAYTWIVVRTDVPGRRTLELIPIFGLAMPFLVKAISWTYVLGPVNGLLNIWIEAILGTSNAPFNVFSMPGAIFVMGIGGVPVAYLILRPLIANMSSELEDASRISGRGLMGTLSRVTIPVLLPGIFTAFLLSVLVGMGVVDYALILLVPPRIPVLATQIYYYMENLSPPSYTGAASLSVIYLVLTFVLLAIYLLIVRRGYKYVVVTGKPAAQNRIELGNWKFAALAICTIVLLLEFGVPFIITVMLAFVSYFTAAPGFISMQFAGLANFTKLFALPDATSSLIITVIMGLIAGVFGTAIGAVLSYIALKSKSKYAFVADLASAIPMAFPGIVYGLALYWSFLLVPGLSLFYGTVWPLVISVTVIWIPVSTRILSTNLVQLSDEMEEASRICGASWRTTFTRIVLPLARGGLVSTFTFTVVDSLREFGGVVLLTTATSEAFIVLLLGLFDAQGTAIGIFAAGSLILILLILVVVVALAVVQAYSNRRINAGGP